MNHNNMEVRIENGNRILFLHERYFGSIRYCVEWLRERSDIQEEIKRAPFPHVENDTSILGVNHETAEYRLPLFLKNDTNLMIDQGAENAAIFYFLGVVQLSQTFSYVNYLINGEQSFHSFYFQRSSETQDERLTFDPLELPSETDVVSPEGLRMVPIRGGLFSNMRDYIYLYQDAHLKFWFHTLACIIVCFPRGEDEAMI